MLKSDEARFFEKMSVFVFSWFSWSKMRFFRFWRKLIIIMIFLYGEYRTQNYFGFFCENRIKKSSFLDFWQIFSCFREAEIRQKWGFPAITRPKMLKFCSNFYQILFVLFLGHCHILTHFGQIGAPGGSKSGKNGQKWGFSAIT